MPILPLHRDNAVGAHQRAARAADALLGPRALDRRVALVVQLRLRYGEYLLGACGHAQTASLAQVFPERQFCHPSLSFVESCIIP